MFDTFCGSGVMFDAVNESASRQAGRHGGKRRKREHLCPWGYFYPRGLKKIPCFAILTGNSPKGKEKGENYAIR